MLLSVLKASGYSTVFLTVEGTVKYFGKSIIVELNIGRNVFFKD